MFGKPKWFQRRKYGGWGICPIVWQGWLYLAFILIPFAIFQSLPIWNNQTRIYVTIGWLILLFLDVGHIMVCLNRDEREYKIEAIAERNATWVMVLLLIIGLLYEIITSSLAGYPKIDLFLVVTLFGGVITKTLSNIFLEKTNLK